MRPLVVGTRKSDLALTQTQWVIARLKEASPGLQVSIDKILTKGDRILNQTLSKIGGKGLFVKEIEQALLDGRIDFAVHSMKDMPAEMPPGLTIGAIPIRENPLDCIVMKEGFTFTTLPPGSVVGTSSLRRQAQLLFCRPDLKVEPVRGNIGTRLQKMKDGKFDALILAMAGLLRMDWQDDINYDLLSPEQMLPAAGQGALAIQCREDDQEILQLLQGMNDAETVRAVRAEHLFLSAFQGGCHLPLATFAEIQGENITLTGLIAHPNGTKRIKDQITGTDEEYVGNQLVQQLKQQGAQELLAEVREGLAG